MGNQGNVAKVRAVIRKEPSAGERYCSDITAVLRVACRALHAQVFAEGADRHGSQVWEAGWEEHGHRYLTIAMTPIPDGGWQLEVWAAASDEAAYSRTLVHEMTTAGGRRPAFRKSWLHELERALHDAAATANRVQPGEPDQLLLLVS